MDNHYIFLLVYTMSVAVASISQLLLKKSTQKSYTKPIYEYLNPLVIVAYIMFFATTILSILALRYIALSVGVVIESTGYIFVGGLSYIFLKEKYTVRKVIGTSLILLGIIIFAL